MRARGTIGENLAAEYLTKKGYLIVQKNFTVRGGEIDLIARHKGMLVFVEVKLRSSDEFGSGEESVTPTKVRRMVRAIERFLALKKCEDADWRIDVIEIEAQRDTNKVESIQHFEDIEV